MSDSEERDVVGEVIARCAVIGAQNVNSAMSTIDALRQQLADVSNERDGLRAALSEDREALQYLLGQFDAEVCVCDRCGEEKEMKDSDSAEYLREYLANVTIWGAQS